MKSNHTLPILILRGLLLRNPLVSCFTFIASHVLESNRSVAHAARCADGREECCERGHCNLHHNLNNSILLHNLNSLTH